MPESNSLIVANSTMRTRANTWRLEDKKKELEYFWLRSNLKLLKIRKLSNFHRP